MLVVHIKYTTYSVVKASQIEEQNNTFTPVRSGLEEFPFCEVLQRTFCEFK